MSAAAVAIERARREALYRELINAGGPIGVAPKLIKKLAVHPAEHGIFRDLEKTRGLAPPSGVALAVRHTGSTYADDLSDDGVIYHYPSTQRGGRRDLDEIASLKAACNLLLPIFVIVTPERGSRVRDVYRGWVTDTDEAARCVLISFEKDPPTAQMGVAEVAFELRASRIRRATTVLVRSGQRKFRFDVIKRYGPQCVACDVRALALLQAAHLCSVKDCGSDDPRNGLVFCMNHHRAIDERLLWLEPETLRFRASAQASLEELGVKRPSLRHLAELPHPEAIAWMAKGLRHRLAPV